MIVEKSIRISTGLRIDGLLDACCISQQRLGLGAVFDLVQSAIWSTEWASQLTVPVTSVVFARMGFGRECQIGGAVKSLAAAGKRDGSS